MNPADGGSGRRWLFFLMVATIVIVRARYNASRLLIGTICDIQEPWIIRDCFTLIRSMRLFGGEMNNATFVVYVPVTEESMQDYPHLLYRFGKLGVELSFTEQTSKPWPKTLNKFTAIARFDTLRYDYFLWMDADLVVFQDPLPYFFPDGEARNTIECVPDFYSYMRRYPNVNLTDLVWNPTMASYILDGEGEVAPHGTCNTGLLFFDRVSLNKFLTILPAVHDLLTARGEYLHDRFLDSLYFVIAVNRAEIEVTTLPYDLNYMAFFEYETFQESGTRNVVMAQFLSDTEMYCFNAVPGAYESCSCLYHNSQAIPNRSPVVERVHGLLPLDICNVMSGLHDPPVPSGAHSQDERAAQGDGMAAGQTNHVYLVDHAVADFKGNTDQSKIVSHKIGLPFFVLDSPAEKDSDIHVANLGDEISIPVRICYAEAALRVGWELQDFVAEVTARMQVYVTEHALRGPRPVWTHDETKSINLTEFRESRYLYSADASEPADAEQCITFPFKTRVEIDLNDKAAFEKSRYECVFEVDIRASLDVAHDVNGNGVIAPSAVFTHSMRYSGKAAMALHVASTASAGAATFTFDPHMGSKPVALDSQLRLAEYHNSRMPWRSLTPFSEYRPTQTGESFAQGSQSDPSANTRFVATAPNLYSKWHTGVTHCCETWKGVETVSALISDWQGNFLMIVLVGSPQLPATILSETQADCQNESDDVCKGRNALTRYQEEDESYRRRALSAYFQRQCDARSAGAGRQKLRCVIVSGSGIDKGSETFHRSRSGTSNSQEMVYELVSEETPTLRRPVLQPHAVADDALALQLALSMTPASIQLFFSDVYLTYGHYFDVLMRMYAALDVHGIMMGSRYDNFGDSEESDQKSHSNASSVRYCDRRLCAKHVRIQTAADTFAVRVRQPLLATHREQASAHCPFLSLTPSSSLSHSVVIASVIGRAAATPEMDAAAVENAVAAYMGALAASAAARNYSAAIADAARECGPAWYMSRRRRAAPPPPIWHA